MRKRIEKEKIKESFEKVKKDIDDLKEKIEFIIKKVQSEPNRTPNQSPNRTEPFIKQVIKRAVTTRPEIIKAAILTLIDEDLKTTRIFDLIVNEKKLCGKTQFYHYLTLVRTELRTKVRTKVRTEPNQY